MMPLVLVFVGRLKLADPCVFSEPFMRRIAVRIALPLTALVSSSRRENIALLPEEGKCRIALARGFRRRL